MIGPTAKPRVAAFHEYERRVHPLQMWQALYRKARFYRVDLTHDQGKGRIGVEISGETCCYLATTQGMRQAITDVEYAFHHDIL
jgi:hypothetical protein